MTHSPRDVRRSTDFSAQLLTPAGDVFGEGRVRNVSSSGLCMEHSLALHPGAYVGIEIPPDESRGRIAILGEVRWANGPEIGLQVTAMMPHHRARYSRLLESL